MNDIEDKSLNKVKDADDVLTVGGEIMLSIKLFYA